ncbi:MAG: ferritin-like domain-containing protein [Armatimonadetes bacterium]|nr:ferritin-like domain-containing protein [Armatimonadota bacterium]
MPKPTTPFTFADNLFGTGDIKVLNYALALEAAEADLYVQALARLTGGGTASSGGAITGLGIAATEPDVQYLQQFGRIEREHRDFLIGALGAQAITATGRPLERATFDFGINALDRRGVVDLIRTVELTGTQAYLGAIPFFVTNQFLAVAGGIQATEARHTTAVTIVQNVLFNERLPTAPLRPDNNGIDRTLTPDQVLAVVSGPNGFIVLP